MQRMTNRGKYVAEMMFNPFFFSITASLELTEQVPDKIAVINELIGL